MVDISTGCTYKHVTPGEGVKIIEVHTAATADSADTILITLAKYGITSMLGIFGCVQSTVGSVYATEAPTTTITTGVLTITVGGASSDKIRSYLIWGV